jgi:general secretion pathway protein D
VEVLPLRHTLAADLAPVVQRLVDASGGPTGPPGSGGGGDAGTRTTVIAEVRSNTLLVRAPNAARLHLIRTLVERLDAAPAAGTMGNLHVVYLKNADATRLAVTLRAALAGLGGSGGGVSAPGLTGGSPGGLGASQAGTMQTAGSSPATGTISPTAAPSTGGQIQADPATNALVITAAEPQYRQLRAVIDRLDTRRAQVFVESLIAEVNADKAAEFGFQWQNVLGGVNGSNIGVAGTNFTIGGTNIIGLSQGAAAGTALPSAGLNLGVVRQINGVYVLSALARFLETQADGNVLSTPNLLTLDNEEARIVIGQNVPFVTGQYTNANTSSTGSVNPFQTIERRDVGLTLRVRPQINENGTVKMQIFQEVSSVQPGSVNSTSGLITNKRSIESTVLVDDGAIVVLGGLLQDEYAGNEQKVPGIGDVPLLGRLFKSETRSRKKTNLMVFLRPVVVRDAVRSDALTLDRYELMRSKQEAAQPAPSVVVPVEGSPVLPPYTAPPALPASPTPPAPSAP